MFGQTVKNYVLFSSTALSSPTEQRGWRGCELNSQVQVYLFCHNYALSSIDALGTVRGTDAPAACLLSSLLDMSWVLTKDRPPSTLPLPGGCTSPSHIQWQ